MHLKKHILVISQYFYPEQFRINDISTEWKKRGYRVTVITGIPNYPQGKFYKGYGFFKKIKENFNGIDIIRLPIIPRGKNKFGLALNYISFVVSGFFWKIFTRINADLVFIFEVSPMTQALPGVWYAKKRRIPCYLYVQDLWPENFVMFSGISNKKIIGVINRMVNYIYANSTKILATSESFVKKIANRGIALNKLLYWPQYAEDFYVPSKKNTKKSSSFNIIFTGNIGYAQGLDILPRVAFDLKNDRKNVIFNIVGDGRFRSELIKEINHLEVSYMFNLIDRQAPEKIPELLAENDAAFLSFINDPLFEMTIPAKLQSYLACGIPIIASVAGESERIITESGSGMACPIGNIKAVSDIIKTMMSMDKSELIQMGKRGLEYYNKNFNKNELLDCLDAIFDSDEVLGH